MEFKKIAIVKDKKILHILHVVEIPREGETIILNANKDPEDPDSEVIEHAKFIVDAVKHVCVEGNSKIHASHSIEVHV